MRMSNMPSRGRIWTKSGQSTNFDLGDSESGSGWACHEGLAPDGLSVCGVIKTRWLLTNPLDDKSLAVALKMPNSDPSKCKPSSAGGHCHHPAILSGCRHPSAAAQRHGFMPAEIDDGQGRAKAPTGAVTPLFGSLLRAITSMREVPGPIPPSWPRPHAFFATVRDSELQK